MVTILNVKDSNAPHFEFLTPWLTDVLSLELTGFASHSECSKKIAFSNFQCPQSPTDNMRVDCN